MASDAPQSDELGPLDGNAVGGLLAECFRGDLTSAWIICTGCGAGAAIGSLPVYGLAMGAIVRCGSCDGVVLRVSNTAGRFWLDIRGAASLRIEPTAQPSTN